MHKRSLLAWLVWSYILLISLWLLLRLLFFDSLRWLALANTIAEYLFLPLPALPAASLWRRAWRLLGLSVRALAFAASPRNRGEASARLYSSKACATCDLRPGALV